MTFMNNTDGQIGTCGPWGQRDIFHPSYGQVKRHQEETDNLHSVWAPSSGLSGFWIGICRYFLPNFFLCTLFLQAGLTRRKHWDLVLLRVILFYTIPRMFEYFKGQQLFTVQFCTTTCTYSALDIWSYNIWAKEPARDPSKKLCTGRGRCFSSYTRQQQQKKKKPVGFSSWFPKILLLYSTEKIRIHKGKPPCVCLCWWLPSGSKAASSLCGAVLLWEQIC